MDYFRLDFLPQPKQRPRFSRASGRVYTSKKTKDSEQDIKHLLHRQMIVRGIEVHNEPIEIKIVFVMLRPKSTKRPWPSVRPDLDNLVKTLLDAGNAVLWSDDAIICGMSVSKEYGDAKKTEIFVRRLKNGIQ